MLQFIKVDFAERFPTELQPNPKKLTEKHPYSQQHICLSSKKRQHKGYEERKRERERERAIMYEAELTRILLLSLLLIPQIFEVFV